MAGNKKVLELPVLASPTGAAMYAVKTALDYQVVVGGANGLAVLDSSAQLPLAALPAHTHAIADVTGLTAALDGKIDDNGAFLDAFSSATAYYNGTSSIINVNNLTKGTKVTVQASGSNTNYPSVAGVNFWYIETVQTFNQADNLTLLQRAYSYDSPMAMATRILQGGSWTAWVYTHHTGNFDPATKSNVGHTHTTADITNLSSYTGLDVRYYTETETDTLLAGKANTSHTHAISDVTGLQAALDSKVVNGGSVATILKITQAAYDALGTKDANTLYVIVG